MTENQDNWKWLTIAEAAERIPVTISKSTLRRWVEEGKHGLISGRFGCRYVIRSDSLPEIDQDYME